MQLFAIARQFNEPMLSTRGDDQLWVHALLSLTFFLVIAGLVVYAIRSATKPKTDANKRSPLEIAQERYAKGELTKEQYTEIKKELK